MRQSYAVFESFKKRTKLKRVYSGGIPHLGAVNFGEATERVPDLNDVLYAANKKLDCDKDGIACEK